ncbi:hypothetical protein [Streptomyces sp. NPDC002855]|uniref:DUF7341 domain-containing protein n=1 Tax=Streptomyces sp. NPDC002855 TaxID=3154437 RepID=UPI003316B14F
MDDAGRITDLVGQLVNGWHERIEYKERIVTHTPDCSKRHIVNYKACSCPESIEARAKSVRQVSLLAQLSMHNQALIKGGSQGGRSAPGSRIPGDITALDLLTKIKETATRLRHDMWVVEGKFISDWQYRRPESTAMILSGIVIDARKMQWDSPQTMRVVIKSLRECVAEARMLLGYEAPSRKLRDVVCGTCGGTLKVAADAQSNVWCGGTIDTPSCGTVYVREEWHEMPRYVKA